MQKFYKILPEKQNTAIALGFFDGLHAGHRSVINDTVSQKANGLVPLCFTFAQRPKCVLDGGLCEAVMTRSDKEKTLAELGIEHVICCNFKEIMNISPQDFVKQILVDTLHGKKLFCGFNYHFGKNGEGNAAMLASLCKKYNVELEVVPPAQIDGQVVSSTLIRSNIKSGNIRLANKMLCGKFGFSAVINHGQRLGRTLGTPTINQSLDPKLVVPKFGVYASAVTLKNGKVYCGVSNIGKKPTVGEFAPLCETWMPDYTGSEIYGQTADIRLIDFIRPEKKFDGIEELKNAIIQNSKTALKIFKEEM